MELNWSTKIFGYEYSTTKWNGGDLQEESLIQD